MTELNTVMTPREIVQTLDAHVIGQADAKRAVAIALRNRWRRMQVSDPLRKEITPKNILMIGPTGVGKTEIARRLAALAQAPFIKVEATKFTEVGYVGRDVESIIRDLAETSIKQSREQAMKKVQTQAEEAAEEHILDILLPPASRGSFTDEPKDINKKPNKSAARSLFRTKLRNGDLDDKEIEIESPSKSAGIDIMAPPGMEEMTSQLQGLFQNMGGDKTKTRKLTVKEALKILPEYEAAKLIDDDEIKADAVEKAEQHGIVFIDEIDKIVRTHDGRGSGEVSREGVQRDLLPLVEGSAVSTKYGTIKTDHILFIASGAFQLAKPSDLIPELQGRLPIRVELNALSTDDFERILTEPKASLIEQYKALMATEGVTLKFQSSAIKLIAKLAFDVNERTENIGARRLYTLMERLLEEISFDATDCDGKTITITPKYVKDKLSKLSSDVDLSRYIL